VLREKWPQIRALARECLPDETELLRDMRLAGAATDLADIHVDEALLEKGLRYHPYIKGRLLLTHLFPVMGIDPMDFVN
jgi:hypothetical protein